jgi:hypothetical protein
VAQLGTGKRDMKSVNPNKARWQIECWKLALAKEVFEVKGFGDRHQLFGLHLCTSLGYAVERDKKKAIFTPANPAALRPHPNSNSLS